MEQGVFVMKSAPSKPLACGATNGQVMLRDPVSLRLEHVLDAHNGTISDLDVRDNLLVTCGFSSRMGQYMVDPYVKVFDIRTLRMVNMVQVCLSSVPATRPSIGTVWWRNIVCTWLQ